LGLSIDWSREFATCDPEYYGQQQALFIDMLAAGLITRKAAVVNWDPVDMTVLANEQVIDGKGWRSGAAVERRELTQWFFKISDYSERVAGRAGRADELAREGAADAGQLDRQVARAAIRVRSDGRRARKASKSFEVYTTRPDTLMGASFAAISPDHPLAKALEGDPKVAKPSLPNAAASAPAEEIETAEKIGYRHRHPGEASARPGLGTAGLDRQLHPDGLWHRRDLRLPGA
jgi:leucyl-tRNA synthetase